MKRADKPLAAEIIQGLLGIAKAGTMRSIYERIQPDEHGIIRSVMSPVGTETGRFSHSESFLEPSTNLANLPKKMATLDPLYNVRECIVPHEGRMLWKADYSQAETRWCAWIAQDLDRIRMYSEGVDQYLFFVSYLQHGDDRAMHEVSKMERQAIGKPGILAGQYGVSWRTMLENVNADADLTGISIDAKTAKRMVAIWPDIFPRTAQWWQEIREQVLTDGFLVNPFGRKRIFFGRIDSENARDAVVREGIAYGPQSANADMLNKALRALFEAHDGESKLLRLLLQVHDEIVGDCAPEDWSKVARIVKGAMEFPVEVHGRELVVPAEVSVSRESWARMRQVA